MMRSGTTVVREGGAYGECAHAVDQLDKV